MEINQLDVCDTKRFLDGFLKLLFGGVFFRFSESLQAPPGLQFTFKGLTLIHISKLTQVYIMNAITFGLSGLIVIGLIYLNVLGN